MYPSGIRAIAKALPKRAAPCPSGAYELVPGTPLNPFAGRPVPTAGPLLDRLPQAPRGEPPIRKVRSPRARRARLW
ncbi:hypothetical protein GCM10020220_020770 [Nonomuraea rubra]